MMSNDDHGRSRNKRENRIPRGWDWTLEHVLTATGGDLVSGHDQVSFTGVSTDSRTVEPGVLFVALKGEHYDGVKFVESAVKSGAAGLLLNRTPSADLLVPVILVDDTLQALGDMASYRRHRMKDLKVIAITGSSGKTTIKEMTASILERNGNVLKTRGNFNNLVGMPLSLLPVNSTHRVAILEMGMNQPGEIARLAEIADPDIVCINNVQHAHLQGLQDINGVAAAKEELFSGAGPDAVLIVNADDKIVSEIAAKYRQNKITFGLGPEAMIRAEDVCCRGEKGLSFVLRIGEERIGIKMRCIGRHNVLNALAASALAYAAGADLGQIAAGLGVFKSHEKRLQIDKVHGGIMVVDDTYNANPASMKAALETVRELSGTGRAVAVLGDMLELGRESAAEHRLVGKAVAGLGFDYLLTYGDFAGIVADAAREEGLVQEQIRAFAGKEEIISFLMRLIREQDITPGDWILVKGSRGIKMETVVSGLREEGE